MKALTIKAPWAQAIAYGGKHGKDVENRTWRTRNRGLLAIHAGKGIDWAATPGAWLTAGLTPYHAGDSRKAWTGSLTLGAIVAVARLAGCHEAGECKTGDGLRSIWALAGQWHWQITEVRPLGSPVACKGALNLWTVPAEAETAVRAQMEER